MYDKKVYEFNGKLLNCIFNNNFSISNWNKDVLVKCEI